MKFNQGIVVLGVAFVAMSCNVDPGSDYSSGETKVQFMPDMVDSPVTKSQRDFLDPPDHSVPMEATFYPETVEEAERTLRNPLPDSSENVAKGEVLFQTFCFPCHGAQAKGDHALGPNYPRPPDLTIDAYKARGDGFFFYRITFGGVIMPRYGHATYPNERWQIIQYLRTLQNKG